MESSEKERILHAATSRFFDAGISKVTLDEIALDVGMSKKTLYKYFESKDALLAEVVRKMMREVEFHLTKITALDEPFEKKLSLYLAFLAQHLSKIGRQFQLDIQRFAPKLWKEIETFRREKVFVHLQKLFQQAQEEGIFRPDIPLEMFYLIFFGAVQGLLIPRVLAEHSFSVTQAFRGLLSVLLEGALTPKAQRRVHSFLETLEQRSMEKLL